MFQNINVDVNDDLNIEEAEFKSLQKSYMKVMISNRLLFFILSSALAVAVWQINEFDDLIMSIVLGVWGLITILKTGLTAAEFKRKAYAVRTYDLHFKSGLLSTTETSVPYNRIQHLEVRQGFFSRLWGLARLKVFTAGDQQHDLSIRGLGKQQADDLKSFLSDKIQQNNEH